MRKNSLTFGSSTFLLLSVLFLFNGAACSPKSNNENKALFNKHYKEAIVEGQQELRQYLLTSFTPGASVAVAHKGELLWSQGAGLANKELDVKVDRFTKFRIGSNSQLLTSYLVAQLHQQGKLHLDSSFYHYVPDFPKKEYDFSPLMLGANVAGFYETNASYIQYLDSLKTFREFLGVFDSKPLMYEPGAHYARSDYGIALLAVLAEEVSSLPYSKLVKEYVIDTLALEHTLADMPLIITENRSAPYDLDYIARLVNARPVNLMPFLPVQGFLSTPEDLVKLGQQMVKPGFFNEETLRRMTTRYRLSDGREINYGFGWIITSDRFGRKVYGSIGRTIGGASMVMVYPEQELVVAMCSNKPDEVNELPADKIAFHFLNKIDPRSDDENSGTTE
ncbi:serine hydrolase domain-containing protein [Roseimarinus sediminis]|uniref:serine hydrolase domain-containing protein n=1 Tax=Roseimarinus sediminis TaxID=1610899 RepID=UPI003D19F2B1